MLTDRAPNTKCLLEYIEGVLCCSVECARELFFVQELAGGGHWYYRVLMSQQITHKLY